MLSSYVGPRSFPNKAALAVVDPWDPPCRSCFPFTSRPADWPLFLVQSPLRCEKAVRCTAASGLMTVYFTITALTAVRPPSTKLKWLTIGAMMRAIVLAVRTMIGGVIAFQQPRGMLNGAPFFMLFFLGIVLSLSAFGDLRVLRTGPLHGRKRLARYLWRMCFALFIAAGSFFSIRARVAVILPDVINILPVRMAMLLMPFAAMFYWLWRIRARTIPQRS